MPVRSRVTISTDELPEPPEPQLISGERLVFSAVQSPDTTELNDSQINSKYIAGETRIG